MKGAHASPVVLLFAACLFFAGNVHGQAPAAPPTRTNAPATLPAGRLVSSSSDDSLGLTLHQSMRRRVVVEPAVKVKNPLQWINPFAPAKYGNAAGNIVRDPITGEVRGVVLGRVSY